MGGERLFLFVGAVDALPTYLCACKRSRLLTKSLETESIAKKSLRKCESDGRGR